MPLNFLPFEGGGPCISTLGRIGPPNSPLHTFQTFDKAEVYKAPWTPCPSDVQIVAETDRGPAELKAFVRRSIVPSALAHNITP